MQQRKLHFCTIEINLHITAEKHRFSCGLDIFDRVPADSIITEALVGAAFFFAKHRYDLESKFYHVEIFNISSNFVDNYPDDARIATYLALLKIIFPDKIEPELQYDIDNSKWILGDF